MICSSEKRFFTSDLLSLWDRTLRLRATQFRGDVAIIVGRFRVMTTIGEFSVLVAPHYYLEGN
jgi:hypothetical protein